MASQFQRRLFDISVEGYLMDKLTEIQDIYEKDKGRITSDHQRLGAAIVYDIVKMSEYLNIDVKQSSDGANVLLAAFTFFNKGYLAYIGIIERRLDVNGIIQEFETVRLSPWQFKPQNFVILLAYLTESCVEYVTCLVGLATLVVNFDFKIEKDEKRRLMYYKSLLKQVQLNNT